MPWRHPARSVLIGLLALALPSSARAGESLQDLVAEALAANPDLASREARVAELQALARVAGSWSDPMVALEYSNAPVSSFSLSDHPMAGLQLRAQQTIRPPAWSRLQRDVVTKRAEAAEAVLSQSELELEATVERLYWQLVLTRQLEQVTQAHLSLTEELLDAVTARYEVGKAGQHTVLRLQVLRDRLADERFEFDKRDREITAALCRALSRPLGTFETPAELDAVAPPADTSTWVAFALEHRPALDRFRAEIEASEAAADLARAEALPDPTFWLGYRIRTVETATDPGTDLVSAGVSVPIPVGSGRRAQGQRAAHLEAAHGGQAQLKSAIDQLEADLETVLARWERAHGKSTTYRAELLPAARATLETTLSDYSVDRADFASLYEAEVALLDLERAMLTATVETHIRESEAAALLGAEPTGVTP